MSEDYAFCNKCGTGGCLEDKAMDMNSRIKYDSYIFTLDELARAYRDIDAIIPDYDMEKLTKACQQAAKNRLWDMVQQVKD